MYNIILMFYDIISSLQYIGLVKDIKLLRKEL